MVPEEYGGLGLTVSQYLPILSELAKVHGGIRVAVHVHNTNAHALTVLGSEDQQRALLPDVAAGTKSVAFALTEPDFGTGAGLGSTAVRDGDEYVVAGASTSSPTRTSRRTSSTSRRRIRTAGELGVSAILVERDPRPHHRGNARDDGMQGRRARS